MGLGAGLLLNVPPDRRGLIDPVDRDRLLDFTGELARRLAEPRTCELSVVDEGDVLARFPEPVRIDHLELREDLTAGQRVTHHEVLADGEPLLSGHTVGVRRVHAFEPRTVRELRVRLTGDGATLTEVNGYAAK